MTLNVVELPVDDLRSVERALDAAREAGLTEIVIIGLDAEGAFWSSLNFSNGPDALWLLELAKARLMHRSIQTVVEKTS